MNKKKKLIITILIICVVLFGLILGIKTIISINRKEIVKDYVKRSEQEETTGNTGYKTPEEVIDFIKSKGETAKYIEEKDGCWYFESKERKFEYCKNEGIIHAYDVYNPESE